MLSFKKNYDIRGELIAINSEFDLPFDIKRIFYIKNMNKIKRGFHAHRKCVQVLIPIQGSFKLKLFDGEKHSDFYLDKSNQGVLIPLYNWLSIYDFSSDCIIMVICSYKYDEEEYIRNYNIFLKEINDKKYINTIANFSLNKQTQLIKREVINKIEKIIDNTAFVMGDEVINFENKFSKYLGCKYTIGLSNGCAALKIAIKALQLKNPKVLIQANTYVAVPLVCEEANIPYDIIDIDDNLLLNLDKLDLYLSNVKEETINFIIIVVHLYGNSIDWNKLQILKEKYNFKIIEDAAQAHGSAFKHIKLGNFGDIGCFSFYPSKNLGAFGEAGAIVTNSSKYAEYAKYYRNYGSIKKYEWQICGGNERMDNIQGAILNIKLKYLNSWNNKRIEIANIYKNNIKNNKIRLLESIDNCESNYHLMIIILDKRDELKEYLEENKISCAIHYPKPFYETNAYKDKTYQNCEIMEKYKNKLLSLPMYPELEYNKVHYICKIINKF